MAKAIVLELNEADIHFVDRFIGSLPMFARMRNEGAFVRTHISGFDPESARNWRSISPWIIWPTVYTGLAPEEHGIVAFGQDTSPIIGRCIWDVLAREGVRVGVMGSLLSHPPRNDGAFYLPESLADDARCFPKRALPLQRFLVETARNYSERVRMRDGVRLTIDLALSIACGVRPRTAMRMLAQLPIERLFGSQRRADRAILQVDLVMDAFESLVREEKPGFACVHSNHVAFMQHRYWRAAEPERFAKTLSPTDARFFRNQAELEKWESHFTRAIERAFIHADRRLERLAHLLDRDGMLVVVSALGQRPFDPARGEIFNPVVRLNRAEDLFRLIGIDRCAIRHQMNPDLTLTFDDEASARFAEEALRSIEQKLFFVQRRDRQVFLEIELRPDIDLKATIRGVPLDRFIALSPTPDQSTAQHTGDGFVLAWSANQRIRANHDAIDVTEIAPTLLSIFDVPPQPWMQNTRIGLR